MIHKPSGCRTVKVCVTRPSLAISRPRWPLDPDDWAADQTGVGSEFSGTSESTFTKSLGQIITRLSGCE